jgi:hypothetical protein
MIVLACLLAGMAIWNFIVGMWIMGLIMCLLAVWLLAEAIQKSNEPYHW